MIQITSPNAQSKKNDYIKIKSFSNTNKKFSNKHSLKNLKEIQKDLINSLSKNPAAALKTSFFNNLSKNTDFKENVERNLSKYQLTFTDKKKNKEIEEENRKFMGRRDLNLIKKVLSSNKLSFYNNTLSSRNEECNLKINVDQKDYGNPYQSLGVIKHNFNIYNAINKDLFFHQTFLFKDQIQYIQQNQKKIRSKIPNVHVAIANSKSSFDIPVVDLTEEKDKKEIKILPTLNHKDGLRLFTYYRYPNKNFPEGREQFSLYTKDKEITICGGLSVYNKGLSIWTLNFEKLEWTKMQQKQYTNNRYGHTSTFFNNKIYFFGGKIKTASTSLSVGLEVFNLIDKTFMLQSPLGEPPTPRKNHIANLIGNNILFHGGITDDDEILNDCFFLNLNNFKWFNCHISFNFPSPKLYGHTSCFILPQEYKDKKVDIYVFPQIEVNDSKLKEKGLYVFGGKSKEEGGLSNKIWILILGQKPLRWVSPETKGKPPSPRYFHSMSYFEKGNFLIIHGGRNDMMSENCALNDTFAFDLENFEFIKVELYSNLNHFKILNRCGHQSAIYGNKLIIFGGMNNHSYIGSALFVVNLDFSYSNAQKTAEELLIKQLEQQKNDPEARRKLTKIKNELKMNNELGIVKSINLPMLK